MKFALRRGASAPDDETTPAPPTGPGSTGPGSTGPGSNGPGTTFAEVVDGHLLWVAVAAEPGRSGGLGLRRTDSGEPVDLPTEQVTDQPGHLGARLDLSALDGEEGRYDVVLHGTEEPPGAPQALVTAPRPPAAVRPSLDGRTRYAVVRSPEGTLRVRASLLPPSAGLGSVRVVPEGIELTLVGAGPQLAIVEDDDVLASWPVDEHGVVVVTSAGVDGVAATTCPAVTGAPGDWRPVRRRLNDLADPRSGAPLPQLDHPGGDGPRLRLPWSREGALQVRVFDLDDETEGPA